MIDELDNKMSPVEVRLLVNLIAKFRAVASMEHHRAQTMIVVSGADYMKSQLHSESFDAQAKMLTKLAKLAGVL